MKFQLCTPNQWKSFSLKLCLSVNLKLFFQRRKLSLTVLITIWILHIYILVWEKWLQLSKLGNFPLAVMQRMAYMLLLRILVFYLRKSGFTIGTLLNSSGGIRSYSDFTDKESQSN